MFESFHSVQTQVQSWCKKTVLPLSANHCKSFLFQFAVQTNSNLGDVARHFTWAKMDGNYKVYS